MQLPLLRNTEGCVYVCLSVLCVLLSHWWWPKSLLRLLQVKCCQTLRINSNDTWKRAALHIGLGHTVNMSLPEILQSSSCWILSAHVYLSTQCPAHSLHLQQHSEPSTAMTWDKQQLFLKTSGDFPGQDRRVGCWLLNVLAIDQTDYNSSYCLWKLAVPGCGTSWLDQLYIWWSGFETIFSTGLFWTLTKGMAFNAIIFSFRRQWIY